MRYLFILLTILGFTQCNNADPKKEVAPAKKILVTTSIPNITKDKSALLFDNRTSLWYLGDTLFSGFAISKYENDALKEKCGILKGKKQNESIHWYPNGQIQSTSYYHQGRLHGTKQVWNQDAAHTRIALLHFENGKAQGEQKKWYSTGELYQILHMKAGREEGTQQAFRKNGALYANYEAKNGRIFGMKKAALCFGLEDQKIKNEK